MTSSFDADLPANIAPDFSAFYRRLQDISGYQLDRLRNATSAALLRDYENELSEAFHDVETRLKALQLAPEDYDRSSEVNAVRSEAEKASRELQQTRQASRDALLAARRGLAARSEAQARAELNLGQKQERSKLADRS
jgi:peptide subunit release factor 1 (eRF1)